MTVSFKGRRGPCRYYSYERDEDNSFPVFPNGGSKCAIGALKRVPDTLFGDEAYELFGEVVMNPRDVCGDGDPLEPIATACKVREELRAAERNAFDDGQWYRMMLRAKSILYPISPESGEDIFNCACAKNGCFCFVERYGRSLKVSCSCDVPDFEMQLRSDDETWPIQKFEAEV